MGDDVRLGEIDVVPDLAIICASLEQVPSIIAQLGARGTRAVIVGPWMWHKMSNGAIATARKAILEAAQPYLMRVLGPGSGGLVVPARGLNASATPVSIKPGKIALVAQSTAVTAAVLDRAYSKGIGFSTVLHLGRQPRCRSRRRARLAGGRPRHPVDPGAVRRGDGRAQVHVGGACRRTQQAGGDHSRRPGAGQTAGERTIHRRRRLRSGPASRRLGAHRYTREPVRRRRGDGAGAPLARRESDHPGQRSWPGADCRRQADTFRRPARQLSPATLKRLEELLQTRSRLSNPLALPADITATHWGAALAIVLADEHTENVLTVFSPSPFAPSAEVAAAICEVSRKNERNVFTCWVGGAAMLEAQKIVAAQGVLSHESPEMAITVFLGVVSYRRNRRLLMQMPPSLAEGFSPDVAAARSALGEAIAAGQGPYRYARHGVCCRPTVCRRRAPAGRQYRRGDPAADAISAIRSISGCCLPMGPSLLGGRVGTAVAGRDPHRGARPSQPCADAAVRAAASAATDCDRARPAVARRQCASVWPTIRCSVR
jgi:acetyltransferase